MLVTLVSPTVPMMFIEKLSTRTRTYHAFLLTLSNDVPRPFFISLTLLCCPNCYPLEERLSPCERGAFAVTSNGEGPCREAMS